MRIIVIKDRDIVKNTTKHYVNLEELLLTEFPSGFEYNTQLFIKKNTLQEINLNKPLADEILEEPFTQETIVIVVFNPAGDGTLQTIIGITMIVIGSYTGNVALIKAGVAVTLGGVSQMMMDVPEIPSEIQMKDTPQADEIYTTQLAQVKPKLGEMLPVGYGRFKKAPDLLSEYTQYVDNREAHNVLTMVGYGDYDINNIFIGDTSIHEFNTPLFYQVSKGTTSTSGELIKEIELKYTMYGSIKINISTSYGSSGNFEVWFNLSGDINDKFGTHTFSVIDCITTGGCTHSWDISEYFFTGRKIYIYAKSSSEAHTIYIDSVETIPREYYLTFSYRKYYNAENNLIYRVGDLGNNSAYRIPIRNNEISNLEVTYESKWSIVSTKRIDEILINMSAPYGIYKSNNDGSLTEFGVSNVVRIKDDFGNEIFFFAHIDSIYLKNSPLNTPILASFLVKKNGNVSCYIAHTETVAQCSVVSGKLEDLFNGDDKNYYIKIYADPAFPDRGTNSRISDKVYIASVFGFKYFEYYPVNYTVLFYRIFVNDYISNTVDKKVVLDITRKDKNNKINQVITDIFSNNVYGGKFSQDFLNLPDTQEDFNHCFTQNQTILEAIRKVAISGMYMLTNDNGISLSKIEQKVRQIVIPSDRYSDLKLEAVTKNEFMKDGYRVYYRNDSYEEVYVTYPENASYPNEIRLYGCSNQDIAFRYAKYLYLSETKRNEKYSFTVGEIGKTLELYTRIGIAIQHLKIGYGGEVENRVENSIITKDNIVFEDMPFREVLNIDFGKIGVIFYKEDLSTSETLNIKTITPTSFTTYENIPSWVGNGVPFNFGYFENFIKDIIIEEIVPNNDLTFRISGRLYNKEIY